MTNNTPSIPGGYAKSWRKELHSDVWLMPPVYHRVWYWLRLNVQHEAYLFPTPGKLGIWVLPGQRITSLRQIAEGVSWKEWGVEKVPNTKTIKAVLDWLVAQEMVTVESNNKGTLISLVNWSSYNYPVTEKVTAEGNSERIADGTRSGYKEECNRRNKNIKPSSSEACRLSELLADLILQNNPGNTNLNNGKREATVARWAADIDKLIRIDGQVAQEIEGVIRWCQTDGFWKAIILSGSKLREKWNQLSMKAGYKGLPGNVNDDRYAACAGV